MKNIENVPNDNEVRNIKAKNNLQWSKYKVAQLDSNFSGKSKRRENPRRLRQRTERTNCTWTGRNEAKSWCSSVTTHTGRNGKKFYCKLNFTFSLLLSIYKLWKCCLNWINNLTTFTPFHKKPIFFSQLGKRNFF